MRNLSSLEMTCEIEDSPLRNAWLLSQNDQFSRAARFHNFLPSHTFLSIPCNPSAILFILILAYTFLYVPYNPCAIL